MVRVPSVVFAVCLFALLTIGAVRPAGAQNTVNQTTCGGATGLSACMTNGFVQDLTVDCNAAGAAGMVSTALAQITDRSGPNRITVSGTCNLGFNIVGFNRLTLQGNNATITRGVNIINSRNVSLRSLTFDFTGTSGLNLNLNGSQVGLDGVTVKNTNGVTAGVVLTASNLGLGGAANFVTGHACEGIDVGNAASLSLGNATVSGNGSSQNCGSQHDGIRIHNGGTINLVNQVVVNGILTDAPVDISGNAGGGISLEGPSALTTGAEGGSASIHIHHNTDPGIALFGGATADIEGHLQFDNNAPAGFDGFPTAQIVAFSNASIFIGEGAQVTGGIAGLFNSFVLIGDGGAMTVTGGVSLSGGTSGFLTAANTIDALTCDGSSYMNNSDNLSAIGTNSCPTAGPAGITGPAGPAGPPGPPGPVTFTGTFNAAGSNGFLSKFSGSTNIANSAIYDSGGPIGIGTTTPADRLHVKFTDTGGAITGYAVQNLGNTSSSYSGMLFYDQNGALGQFQGFNNVTHEYRINNIASGSTINFMLGSSSKFLVSANGNIGIGTTTPAVKLQVSGDVRVGTAGSNGCVQSFSGSVIGGTCSSDRRLKQKIQPFGPVLDKVTKLKPVSYEWRRDEHPEYQFGPTRTTGLIAQEVEQVFPGMVAQDDRGYKAVNYSELPLLLLQAIRELKADNDALRSALEGQRREFQAQLDAIKHRSR